MEKRSAGGPVTPSRLEMFSDAVLAIAITLLVLEIRMPHLDNARSGPEAWRALVSLMPRFAGYLLSFFFIAVFWINHHRFFLRIRRVDDGLVWWNVALLLCLSFIPFPTAVIGEYPMNPVPILFFAGVFMLAGIVFNVMWRHARRRDLYHDFVAPAEVAHVVKWGLFGPILYAITGILSLVSPIPSWVMLILIPFLFVIPIKARG